MNETVKTIMDRYTCRDFSPSPLEKAQVETLVNVALAAPSAVNRQPWHIIAITDKALIEEMDAYIFEGIKQNNPDWYNRMLERGGKIFYNAPAIFVIAKDDSDFATLDTGIVAQNIALAAHSLGLGSVICGMARGAFEGAGSFAQRIGLPEGMVFGMSVCVGTPKSGKAPHELDYNKVSYIGG